MFQTAIKNIENRCQVKISKNSVKELDKDDRVSIGALGYYIFDKIYLVAPIRSLYTTTMPAGRHFGNLVEIQGCYQEPRIATVSNRHVPALTVTS